MNKVKVLVVVTFVALLALSSNALGQRIKFPFGNKNTVKQNSRTELDDKAGPWLVMCASFVGESGRQQAYRLAEELQVRHRLKAYVYSHKFDFEKKVTSFAKGYEPYQVNGVYSHRPIQMKTASPSKFEEVAVLIGDFATIDDSRAQKTLAYVKTLHPESLLSSSQSMDDDSWREGLRKWREKSSAESTGKSQFGPLKAAFLMPNPMIPDEYFTNRKLDDFIVKFNNRFKYTLLKNPAKYSVKIATFVGDGTLKENEIAQTKAKEDFMIRNRRSISSSKLMDAAKKATILTAYLRGQGIEAWEFHDEDKSYVTVGSYDWIQQTGSDGTRRNNPAVVEQVMKFRGTAIKLPGKGQSGLKTYQLPNNLAKAGINCDVQPEPIQIPKAPATARVGSRIFNGFRR